MKNTSKLLLLILFWGRLNAQEIKTLTQKKGFVNHTEIGVLLGKNYYGTTAKASFSANTFNGYRFNHRLAVGATIGLDWYNSVQVMPIALGLRGDLLKNKKSSPFYGLDAGYGLMFLSTKQEYETLKGGPMINPSIGYRFAIGNGNALSMSIGWKHQITYSVYDYPEAIPLNSLIMRWAGNDQETTKYFNRIALKIGFSF